MKNDHDAPFCASTVEKEDFMTLVFSKIFMLAFLRQEAFEELFGASRCPSNLLMLRIIKKRVFEGQKSSRNMFSATNVKNNNFETLKIYPIVLDI